MQVQPRKLVVRHRPKPKRRHDDSSSLSSHFVRLHPATAQALWKDALLAADAFKSLSDEWDKCWNVMAEKAVSTQVSSGIEFLPLSIQSSGDVAADEIVFASYNGGDIMEGKFPFRLLFFLRKDQ